MRLPAARKPLPRSPYCQPSLPRSPSLAAPHGRCWALLLFYSIVVTLLLPLLLLVPLRQRRRQAGGSGTMVRPGLAGQADRCIEVCLRSLLWPAAADVPLMTLAALAARWLLLLALLWMGCCLLAEPD